MSSVMPSRSSASSALLAPLAVEASSPNSQSERAQASSLAPTSDIQPTVWVGHQARSAGPTSSPLCGSEELAYREFYHRYEPPITGLARNRGLSRHDAEDVVQEVMLAAWRHLNGTVARDGCDHFRGLVLRIAGNKTFDHLRRQRARPAAESLTGTGADLIEAAPGPAEVYERKVELAELAGCLQQCRRDVARRTFDAFHLYVLDETSATETAARVDMSVNQVYVTRHQVIQRLRGLMPPRD